MQNPMRLTPQNSFSKLVMLNERTSTVLGGEKFRYGYQSSEMDNEVKGEGNSYTTEFRQLDTRLGRWLAIDPKPEAGISLYSSMDNNPIRFNDILGLYTKNRAEKMKAIAEKKGYSVSDICHSETAGRKGYYFNISKRNEANTGTYVKTMMNGGFNKMNEKNLTLDSEITGKVIENPNNLFNFFNDLSLEQTFTSALTTQFVSSKYKTNSNFITFEQLKDEQQLFRATAQLGKRGGKTLISLGKTGNILAIAAPIIHGYSVITSNKPISTQEKVDLGVETGGAIVVIGILAKRIPTPIGVAWSAGSLLYDYEKMRMEYNSRPASTKPANWNSELYNDL